MAELNKNLPTADHQPDGAKPEGEATEAKTLWFFQATEPVSADHKRFLDTLAKVTANLNNQQ